MRSWGLEDAGACQGLWWRDMVGGGARPGLGRGKPPVSSLTSSASVPPEALMSELDTGQGLWSPGLTPPTPSLGGSLVVTVAGLAARTGLWGRGHAGAVWYREALASCATSVTECLRDL